MSLGRNTQKTSGGAANCRPRPEHFPFPLLLLPTLGYCVQQVAAVDLVHFILTAIHHHHHPFNAHNNSSGSKNEPTERHSCQGPVSFFRTILSFIRLNFILNIKLRPRKSHRGDSLVVPKLDPTTDEVKAHEKWPTLLCGVKRSGRFFFVIKQLWLSSITLSLYG